MLNIDTLKDGDVVIALDTVNYDKDGNKIKVTKYKEYIISYYNNIATISDDSKTIRDIKGPKSLLTNFDRLYLFKLKEIDEIKIGDTVEMIMTIGAGHQVGYPEKGDIVTIQNYDKQYYNFKEFPRGLFLHEYLKSYTNCWFKKVQPKKETQMLDSEIYAVGTIHKSVNGKNEYKVIVRDITVPNQDNMNMIVQNIKTGYNSLRNQNTGRQTDKSNESCDLAVKTKKISGWINLYKDYKNNSYVTYIINETKQEADKKAKFLTDRIACLYIECEKGEGL